MPDPLLGCDDQDPRLGRIPFQVPGNACKLKLMFPFELQGMRHLGHWNAMPTKPGNPRRSSHFSRASFGPD